jgi:putative transposase
MAILKPNEAGSRVPDLCREHGNSHKSGLVNGLDERLVERRTFVRTFNVIDDFSRECLTIDVDFTLPTQRVIRSLKRIIEWRGKPSAIRCDNGPEYISQDLIEWANQE